MIAAALAAGAGAGITDSASVAVRDAYAGLKDLLRHRMGDRAEIMDSDDIRPEVWVKLLGDTDLDAPVLAAAQRLLELSGREPAKTFDIDVANNYGAVGDFAAPITFNQGLPVPPAAPAAATGHPLPASPSGPRTDR